MARKITGPFCDVTIQTIGHMGSTSVHNDAFFKLVLDEIAIYSNTDELSSAKISSFVEKIQKKSKAKKTTHTNRNNTRKLNPKVDLFGSKHYIDI